MFAQPMAGAVCAIALALVLAAPVRTAVAEQASPAALATAKELIAVKGGNSLYEPIAPGVIEKAKSVFLQSNPALGKDLNEVAAKLRAEYAARTAELLNDAAKIYAGRFKEQELKDALAFYKSPLGRKLLLEEPRILDESMKHAQSWADRLSEEVINKMRVEMKKRGHEI
jgi:uncharacterized protein